MRMQRGAREAQARVWLEPGPEVATRMALDGDPGAAIVGCYVLTRGAERAWAAINHQLTLPRGAFFWIGGGASTGKTHFLNYTVALSKRAAAADSAAGRHLTLAVDASERAGAGELDRQVLDQLALQLAGDSRGAPLWRQLRGAKASGSRSIRPAARGSRG